VQAPGTNQKSAAVLQESCKHAGATAAKVTSERRDRPGAKRGPMNYRTALLTLTLGFAVCATAADAPTPSAGAPRALNRNVNDATLQWGPCPPLFAAGCQIAVLQGDPAKPHADVFFRIPAGYRIAAHTHTSAEHIVLVTGELEVQYRGQKAVLLKTGDFAYGPPGLPHVGRCLSSTPCTLFISFEQAVDALPHTGPIS